MDQQNWRALLNPGMNFGESANLHATLSPKFILQISNANWRSQQKGEMEV